MEATMADGGGGVGVGVGLIVGALVVVVAIIGVAVFAGGNFGATRHMDVNVHAPGLTAPSATPGK
jgi:hypothetical protein